MSSPVVLLSDNGSKRAAATLQLRQLTGRLSALLAEPVHPVSLQHAGAIPAAALQGEPAQVLTTFMQKQLEAGQREFVMLPLFFGQSGALTAYLPQQLQALRAQYGNFDFKLAPELVPMPAGEEAMVSMLQDQVHAASASMGTTESTVILTDHGSPAPQVTAVREWLADRLTQRLLAEMTLLQAVMERRTGADYDFNGELLLQQLEHCATTNPERAIIISMLFLLPGRHAEPGGDIAVICADVKSRYPQLQVITTALIAEHPRLPELLQQRRNSRDFTAV